MSEQAAGTGIRVLSFKPIDGKYIKGEVDLVLLRTRLRIPKCTYREDREGYQSIVPPERRLKDGESFRYEPIVEFTDDAAKRSFSQAALRALEEFQRSDVNGWNGGDNF